MKSTTEQILDVFEGFRMNPTPQDKYEEIGKSIFADKLFHFVANNKPIEFVMLGFPFKSTNMRDKVIGQKPDLAEEVTLANFARFNEAIKLVYPPGMTMAIASDGYIFNEMLGVPDQVVQDYGEINAELGKDAPMQWFNLKQFYAGHDLSVKRTKVLNQFGITPEQLDNLILFNEDANYLYRGMVRFMNEELSYKEWPSGKQLQKAAKLLTREMMLMNEAWSNLVKHEFNKHIRLSMHPSINDGNKFSYKLLPGLNTRHSAWHCAIYLNGDEYVTMHRKDADAAGLQLVYKDNQPYYYTNNN